MPRYIDYMRMNNIEIILNTNRVFCPQICPQNRIRRHKMGMTSWTEIFRDADLLVYFNIIYMIIKEVYLSK